MLMVSGMAMINLYPFAAATIARAIPVFPDVGSTKIVLPGVIKPSCSADSIIFTPIRSLTDEAGFIPSNLTTMSATQPSA